MGACYAGSARSETLGSSGACSVVAKRSRRWGGPLTAAARQGPPSRPRTHVHNGARRQLQVPYAPSTLTRSSAPNAISGDGVSAAEILDRFSRDVELAMFQKVINHLPFAKKISILTMDAGTVFRAL